MLYVEQTLTNEQQAQARENIAALGQNELAEAVEEALAQAKSSGEFDGNSVTITSVSESSEDAGTNTVTFSDGKVLNIKNGKTGAAGKSAYQSAQDNGFEGTEQEWVEGMQDAIKSINGLTPDEYGEATLEGNAIPGVVLYMTQQELTDGQKAQARMNIGVTELNIVKVDTDPGDGAAVDYPEGTWVVVR